MILTPQLLKLRVKKYLSRYEYIVSEYEETQFLFEQYKEMFYSECPKQIIANGKDKEKEEEQGKGKEEKQGPVNEYEKSTEEGEGEREGEESTETSTATTSSTTAIESLMNKIYKKLSLKTHPDKHKGDSTNFIKVSTAYKSKDILSMLLLARHHEIDVDIESCVFSETDFELFESAINKVTDKISDIKNTLAWNWVLADDVQKQMYREQFHF